MKTENNEKEALNKTDVNHSVFIQYLPHKLKGLVKWEHKNKTHKVELYGVLQDDLQIENPYGGFDYCSYKDFKPILRPIQEVEQYFEKLYGNLEHQDVTDYFDADFLQSHDNIEIEEIQLLEAEQLPYGTIKVLLKHHFDVFDLISKGLAVSIHDVE